MQWRLMLRIALILALSPIAVTQRVSTSPVFDVLILNGRIIDGSGNPWYYGDVGIRGDRIAAIGKLAGVSAESLKPQSVRPSV